MVWKIATALNVAAAVWLWWKISYIEWFIQARAVPMCEFQPGTGVPKNVPCMNGAQK